MYKEQIDAFIKSKKEEMLADLSALVSINSIRGEAQPGMPYGEGPAKVLDKMGELMRRYGLSVTDYDHYAVTGDFSEKEKELDILAHLDVVPVTEDWTVTQPFTPLIKDGRIYGRGTSDDKGPAVAALYAVRAIKELGIPLKRSVRLICGSDEECGSSDLEHYYSIEKEAPCTFTPDADFPLINLEKARLAKPFACKVPGKQEGAALLSFVSGDKVNVVPGKAEMVIRAVKAEDAAAAAAKVQESTGAVFTVSEDAPSGGIRVLVKGTAAHAATPQEGNSALTAGMTFVAELAGCGLLAGDPAAEAIVRLLKIFPHGDTSGKASGIAMSDEVSGALTQNLGILCYDREAGTLSGQYDMRAPLCANDDNLTAVSDCCLKEALFTPEEGKMKPAHYVPADSSFVQTLLGSYERYFGKKGTPLYTGGGTYVHELERGVAFGCMIEGVDNHMHGDDEFMEISTLLISAKIFADVIVKLCG